MLRKSAEHNLKTMDLKFSFKKNAALYFFVSVEKKNIWKGSTILVSLYVHQNKCIKSPVNLFFQIK